jgi:hypothetical protein
MRRSPYGGGGGSGYDKNDRFRYVISSPILNLLLLVRKDYYLRLKDDGRRKVELELNKHYR